MTRTSDTSDRVGSFDRPATEIEKEHLLEELHSSSDSSFRKSNTPLILHLCYAVLFLLLSNLVLFALLIISQRDPVNSTNLFQDHNLWLPPENTRKEIFTAHTIYGDFPSDEVQEAWNALMPVGRGFVTIKNETILPPQPRLNQSITTQHAMISVFHQLHCLYMTREGYYAARAGNLDGINHIHLSHCWDYLRQAIMCFSDTSLEWIQAPPNDLGSTGWGYQHTCRDFGAVYSWAEENRFRSGTGIH